MNYLAHLALAYPNDRLVVGNFIGDHVRNKDLPALSATVQAGVAMHRNIDIFTDKHAVTIALRKLLFSKHRHLARVLMDVFYDHFLAKHFDAYHDMPLSAFIANVQPILQKHESVLPHTAQRYLAGMITQGWLAKYQTQEGIAHILQKMAHRSRLIELVDGAKSLAIHYDTLQDGFSRFYPDLQQHCDAFKESDLKL